MKQGMDLRGALIEAVFFGCCVVLSLLLCDCDRLSWRLRRKSRKPLDSLQFAWINFESIRSLGLVKTIHLPLFSIMVQFSWLGLFFHEMLAVSHSFDAATASGLRRPVVWWRNDVREFRGRDQTDVDAERVGLTAIRLWSIAGSSGWFELIRRERCCWWKLLFHSSVSGNRCEWREVAF